MGALAGLSPPIADRIRRQAASLAVVALRLRAAQCLHAPNRSDHAASELLERALGITCTPSMAAAALSDPGGAHRMRGLAAGLSLWGALRERFDQDWYRNPRAREVLDGALERGGSLAVERLLGELGAHPAPEDRLREWFRG